MGGLPAGVAREGETPSEVGLGHGQAIHGIPWTPQDNPGTLKDT